MKSKAITLPAHLFADHAHYVKNKRSAHLRKKQKRGGRRRDHLKPTSLSVWSFKWNLSSKFFFTSRYNHIALSKQVLTFESMDESLRCDQSKENSSAIIWNNLEIFIKIVALFTAIKAFYLSVLTASAFCQSVIRVFILSCYCFPVLVWARYALQFPVHPFLGTPNYLSIGSVVPGH